VTFWQRFGCPRVGARAAPGCRGLGVAAGLCAGPRCASDWSGAGRSASQVNVPAAGTPLVADGVAGVELAVAPSRVRTVPVRLRPSARAQLVATFRAPFLAGGIRSSVELSGAAPRIRAMPGRNRRPAGAKQVTARGTPFLARRVLAGVQLSRAAVGIRTFSGCLHGSPPRSDQRLRRILPLARLPFPPGINEFEIGLWRDFCSTIRIAPRLPTVE